MSHRICLLLFVEFFLSVCYFHFLLYFLTAYSYFLFFFSANPNEASYIPNPQMTPFHFSVDRVWMSRVKRGEGGVLMEGRSTHKPLPSLPLCPVTHPRFIQWG